MLLTDFYKRLYAVRTQIWIDSGKVHIESCSCEMSPCVCLGGRTYIASLDIADHDQPLGSAIVHGPSVRDHAGNPKLLIHRDLGFHGRYDIVHSICDRFIKLPYSFRRDHVFLLAVLRNIPFGSTLRLL